MSTTGSDDIDEHYKMNIQKYTQQYTKVQRLELHLVCNAMAANVAT